MRCIYCRNYFKQSAFNASNECDDCYSTALDRTFFDEDAKEELDRLKYSSKTPAVFYKDDYEDPIED